ncbi:MAG: exodeoxyribonuclease VII large subunit [Saccharofermentanales bacterium]
MAVISVTQLNRYVASVLDSDSNLSGVQVTGEISSFRRYPSGHLYFTLKDAGCSVSCVMFRSSADTIQFNPEDGMKVIVDARASLYDRDGKFQLYVNYMKPDGIGDLYAAFELLKQKLQNEGLFSADAKKPIPLLPRRIGVATSSSGAVIRDIINVLGRRFPGFNLLLIPVKVQGEGAAASIVKAIEAFNQRDDIDVIIVGRGGGSMEDLWCFNDESVARAVYVSRIPVVSAVGHETDFTICDFAADLRAPTPSAAAELVIPVRQELEDRLDNFRSLLKRSLTNTLEYSKLRLHHSADSVYLTDPYRISAVQSERITICTDKIKASIEAVLRNSRTEASMLLRHLDSLSPLKVLDRGYGIIENLDTSERIISYVDVSAGDKVKVIVSDGIIKCSVLSAEEGGFTFNER